MALLEWLTEFRVLHDKARSDNLSDHDAKLYKDGREQLAAALVQAQRLTRNPEESARQALRVARAVQVDLELNSGKQRVVTLDISIGGFSARMGVQPERGKGPHRGAGEGRGHRAAGRREPPRLIRFRRAARARYRAAQYPGVRHGALASGRKVKPAAIGPFVLEPRVAVARPARIVKACLRRRPLFGDHPIRPLDE